MRQSLCPDCAAINRLPAERNAAAARCGRCGEKLFQGAPLDVDARGLAARRKAGETFLLDVWAPWCGPCRAMAPQFIEAARMLEPDVRLLKLNAEAEPVASAELGVAGIPALLLFDGGREIARTAGAMPADAIVKWTRQALPAAASAMETRP